MITIVLPAYNEELTIGPLLESIKAAMEDDGLAYNVLIVNDGSRDKTAEVVTEYGRTMPLRMINHSVNKGLPEAIKTGLFSAANQLNANDIVITMDADNTHSPGLILRMVRLLKEGSQVVIASRYQPGAHIRGLSKTRRLLSYGANLMFRILLPIPGAKDYSCGFRAYRASVLKEAIAQYGDTFISQPGFSCMIDILLKIGQLDPIVTEVPLILRYDLKESASKMNVSGNVKETLGLLLKRFLGMEDWRFRKSPSYTNAASSKL